MQSTVEFTKQPKTEFSDLVFLEEGIAEMDDLFYKFYGLLRRDLRERVSFSNVLHAVLPLRLHSITWFTHCKPAG